jgi:hypothetical protein
MKSGAFIVADQNKAALIATTVRHRRIADDRRRAAGRRRLGAPVASEREPVDPGE